MIALASLHVYSELIRQYLSDLIRLIWAFECRDQLAGIRMHVWRASCFWGSRAVSRSNICKDAIFIIHNNIALKILL